MSNKQIKNLRPSLRTVAPLTYWISFGFVWANVMIFFLLSRVSATAIKQNIVPVVSAPFPTYDHWGFWFLILGLTMLFSLLTNNWLLLKRALIAGLISKLIWAYALLYMILHGLPVFATFILWAFLAWVQAWTIIFFVPTITDSRHDVLPENGGTKT